MCEVHRLNKMFIYFDVYKADTEEFNCIHKDCSDIITVNRDEQGNFTLTCIGCNLKLHLSSYHDKIKFISTVAKRIPSEIEFPEAVVYLLPAEHRPELIKPIDKIIHVKNEIYKNHYKSIYWHLKCEHSKLYNFNNEIDSIAIGLQLTKMRCCGCDKEWIIENKYLNKLYMFEDNEIAEFRGKYSSLEFLNKELTLEKREV